MVVIQSCKKGCPLNEGQVSSGKMLGMSLHKGRLILGRKTLSERCPSCGKIAVWTIENEPRHGNVRAQEIGAATPQT